jgi:hypothetical protein
MALTKNENRLVLETLMKRSEQVRYDIRYGLHSRIPTCCIIFFVTEWESIYREGSDMPYNRAVDAARAGYVQCPECLGSGTKVKILDCDLECGGNHRGDFDGD